MLTSQNQELRGKLEATSSELQDVASNKDTLQHELMQSKEQLASAQVRQSNHTAMRLVQARST